MTQTYHCDCGDVTGAACEWDGPLSEMVVLEYIEESLRDCHAAARNSGTYGHNGAIRLAVSRKCAEIVMDDEAIKNPPSGCCWAWITYADPALYVTESDS